MFIQFKDFLKSHKALFKIALFIQKQLKLSTTEGTTKLNILKSFPMYEAHGLGLYTIRAKLTISSINQTLPALAKFASKSEKNTIFQKEFEDLLLQADNDKQIKLARYFNQYGSDKATSHNYYKIYAEVLGKLERPRKILEIGLGTNNSDIVSTMGSRGKPGASLRAFRDFQENCEIFGADFDKRILFSENRINTFFVDQTDPTTFEELSKNVGFDFDLMIDDGLHSPNANLHSLKFFVKHLRLGGYAIIEDIHPSTKPIWEIVSELIEPNFVSAFLQTKSACLFIARKEK